MEITDQGLDSEADIRRRLEDQPRSRQETAPGRFGRPGVNKGEQAAFPQARVVALAECGTHAVFAAEIGTYSQSEATLNGPLLDRLEPGMLLPADRTPAAERAQELMLVRVIGYSVDDGRKNPTTYSLFTALLDPAQASAVDLAVAHTGAVGDRTDLRRAQDPPTWTTHRAAQQVPRPGLAGDLGTSVLPLRDPVPDGRRRHPLRTRPRPRQLRRRATHHPPDPRPPGRFSPLTSTTATAQGGSTSCAGCYTDSTRHAATAQRPASSNANTPSGTSNAPTTPPGPSQQDHRPTPPKDLTERYWG